MSRLLFSIKSVDEWLFQTFVNFCEKRFKQIVATAEPLHLVIEIAHLCSFPNQNFFFPANDFIKPDLILIVPLLTSFHAELKRKVKSLRIDLTCKLEQIRSDENSKWKLIPINSIPIKVANAN